MIKGLLLDLDGTIYWGKDAVEGAVEFVAWAQARGIRCLYVTNRANRLPETICEQLAGYGVACTTDDVVTSALATAQYIGEGSVYCVGEAEMVQEFERQGLVVTDENPDYVVVSFDRLFTYAKMKTACQLIDQGATFIATNPDKGLRAEDGILPGTGAIVAAVAAGCGVEPTVVGKPEKLIMEMSVERIGLPKEAVLSVGDNVTTDILGGDRAGLRTVLMLTGISRREDLEGAEVQPTWVAADYEELKHIIDEERL